MLIDNILIHAVQSDNVQGVKHLVMTQSNLMTEPGKFGDTALHCVAWNGINEDSSSSQIFDILLVTAIKLNTAEILLNKQNIIGETPLTRAFSRAKTINDIFTQRTVRMIQCGAKFPDTPHAKRIFGKLPLEVQKFIQDQLNDYQQKIKDESQAETSKILSDFARSLQADSIPSKLRNRKNGSIELQ